jgi:hypothetical protein
MKERFRYWLEKSALWVDISSYVLCESRKAVTTKIKSNNSDRDVVEYYYTLVPDCHEFSYTFSQDMPCPKKPNRRDPNRDAVHKF